MEPKECACGEIAFDIQLRFYGGEWSGWLECEVCGRHRMPLEGPTPQAALEAAIVKWGTKEDGK